MKQMGKMDSTEYMSAINVENLHCHQQISALTADAVWKKVIQMAKLPKDTITHYEHDGKGNINITITDLIRCKDCKHWDTHKRLQISWCRYLHIDMGSDSFCSYAERKEE